MLMIMAEVIGRYRVKLSRFRYISPGKRGMFARERKLTMTSIIIKMIPIKMNKFPFMN